MWAKYFAKSDPQLLAGEAARFPHVLTVSFSDNLPAWQYPWHLHKDSLEFAYVYSGTGFLELEDIQTPLKKGDICLIPAGLNHRFGAAPGPVFSYYTLRIKLEPSGPLQAHFAALPHSVASGLNYYSYICETFGLLLNLYEMNGGEMDDTMQSLIFSLLMLTKTLFSSKPMTLRIERGYSLSDVIQYINDHASEPLTLQSIADHFHLSASHLSRLFSKAYHSSPINYLISVRMANASDLLISTTHPISEIAAMVGYDNFSHFNVLFHKRIGCTPHEFRQRNSIHGSQPMAEPSPNGFGAPRLNETKDFNHKEI